jgi:hypothetical protein
MRRLLVALAIFAFTGVGTASAATLRLDRR